MLKDCYNSLPSDVKNLFDFNTGLILYDESASWNVLAITEKERRKKPRILIFASLFENMTHRVACKRLNRTLTHELAHTLDIYNLACNPRAKSLLRNYRDILRGWYKVIEKEPDSTELPSVIEDDGESIYLWAMEPREQWACRFALTIMVDYLVPAGLVPKDDLSTRRSLSVKEFKTKWPKSYRFFHNYIRMILTHVKKK